MSFRYTFAAALVLVCAAYSPAAAQTTLSLESELETELSAAPRPGQSGVSATIGGQIQDGRTETIGMAITGVAAHTTKKKQLLRFDVQTNFAKYRPATTGPLYLAKDDQTTGFTFLQTVKTRYAVFAKSGWRRDEILGLDYRAWVEGGGGMEIVTHKKVNAFLGGSYAVGHQHRSSTPQGGAVLELGLLQTLNVTLTPVLSFHEWFMGRFQTTDSDDNSHEFNATLVAKVSKHAGLKIAFQRQYDSVHPSTVSALQTQLIVGMSISFQPAAAKP